MYANGKIKVTKQAVHPVIIQFIRRECIMSYNIIFSCISHIGKVRSINQDNFICNGQYMELNDPNIKFPLTGRIPIKDHAVFGVFDGMGGEECGEIAAYIAAKAASELVIDKNIINDISQYCISANEKICTYARDNSVASMGTTVAMLVFSKAEIILCNIGDSKVFMCSDGKIEQISQDHVMISSYGVKPPLSQNLGIPETELLIEPYIARGYYKNNDIYLMCSDGLTDMVDVNDIKEILLNTEIENAASELIGRALRNGGKDNISAIVCKIENNSLKQLKKRGG